MSARGREAAGLRQLQRSFAAAVMTPLNSAGRIRPGAADVRAAKALVKGSRALNSVERLEIYSRSYWFRLLESLGEDFPGTIAILGWQDFSHLALAYLRECPSESFTLRDLGSRLEPWLRRHPKFAGSNRLLTLDMVQLEWAHIVAFDGARAAVLEAADLAGFSARTKLALHPCMSLLELHYPVDELRIGVNASPEGAATASNVALEKKHRLRTGRMAGKLRRSKPGQLFLAVHRFDLNVFYRRLQREEFLLLRALRQGQSVGRAIAAAFEGSPINATEVPALLQGWFAHWAQLGWLCKR